MAVFRGEIEEFQRLDWRLLQDGSINLYFRQEYLVGDIVWLREQGYEIDEFDCSKWVDDEIMHNDFGNVLNFPDYYGQNLDALNDCLSDLQISISSGRVLVFKQYDVFADKYSETAWHVLDILENRSRSFLLFGLRLITLVQSNNPTISFEQLGGCSARWNPKEWLNKNRGL